MQNKSNDPMEDILQDPYSGQEIGADELAVHIAGLTHPDDVELEQILAEDWDSVPDQEEPVPVPDEALEQFLAEEDPPEFSEDPTQVIPSPITEETQAYPQEYSQEEDVWEEEDSDCSAAPVRKGRPKWKKGYGLFGIPHIISTVIWLLLVVAIGVSLGNILWVCCADVMSFGKPEVTASITVTDDDDIDTVAQKLADANLIRYPGLFKQFAQIANKEDKINAGTYELGSHLDYNAMINNMIYTSSALKEVTVVFSEGYTCAQMFQLLEDNGVCSVADLEYWAAEGELSDYWFLEGVSRGDKYCLEGYMAPDTYRFYENDDPRNVLEKFLNEFDDRFTDIMKDDFATMQTRYAQMLAKNGFDSAYIEANPLTLHQVVTMASVVEREFATSAECYDIASVFYNRLTNPNIKTMGSDATVRYAVGDYFHELKELTDTHMAVDSPYNTHKAEGFPPGPICNPSAYALYAALDPNDTSYLYYYYDEANNKHLFAKNRDEHQRNVESLGE